MNDTQCSVEGCDRAVRTRGMCNRHYSYRLTQGKIELLPVLSVAERLASNLRQMPNGCLEWTGTVNHRGYGQTSVSSKRISAHRLAWELVNGPIPDGMFVLHRCDNRRCCLLAHLFLGTPLDNMRDMIAKGRSKAGASQLARTHCPQGHPYDEANTYVNGGRRTCRACRAARERDRKIRLNKEPL